MSVDYAKMLLSDWRIGSVTPSSPQLVDRMVKWADAENAHTIIEYGPAAGVITHGLLAAMPSASRLFAIEFNRPFFEQLRKEITDPRLRPICGNALYVDKMMRMNGVQSVDCVVSGLPFSIFSDKERDGIMEKTANLLGSEGHFVGFCYSLDLHRTLKRFYRNVGHDLVVRNWPPAFVCVASDPFRWV